MKVVQINTVFGRGSTGRIVRNIQNESLSQGIDNVIAYRYCEDKPIEKTYCVSTWLDCHAHNRIARYTHRTGFYSYIRTLLFLRYLTKEKPDILHLHNLHGSYIHIGLLFDYIKKHQIKVVWTFHDCWPFTGYCPYYDILECEEWKKGCKACRCETNIMNKHSSERNLRQKKQLASGLDLTIVTPSRWLADIVKQSFFRNSNVVTIPNGLDLELFCPRESDFRAKYGIPDGCFILLGVASVWEERKGLDVFIELSKRLNSEQYRIVLVGTNDKIDSLLPDNIISIHRTDDQIELAEIYTASDVFINPTKDEVLGMVNIEANACGTPVITYNSGGSPECINNKSGIVVECNDVDAIEKAVLYISGTRPFSRTDCIACASQFDMHDNFRKYVDLYRNVANSVNDVYSSK